MPVLGSLDAGAAPLASSDSTSAVGGRPRQPRSSGTPGYAASLTSRSSGGPGYAASSAARSSLQATQSFAESRRSQASSMRTVGTPTRKTMSRDGVALQVRLTINWKATQPTLHCAYF